MEFYSKWVRKKDFLGFHYALLYIILEYVSMIKMLDISIKFETILKESLNFQKMYKYVDYTLNHCEFSENGKLGSYSRTQCKNMQEDIF